MAWPGVPPLPIALALAAQDEGTRWQLYDRLTRLDQARLSRDRFPETQAIRERATAIREKTLARLGDYLVQAERAAARRGFEVAWAESKAEAVARVAAFLGSSTTPVAILRSAVVEELDLPAALERSGHEVIMADAGGLITWTVEERPAHRVAALAHMHERDVALLWEAYTGQRVPPVGSEVVAAAQDRLRSALDQTDAILVGAQGVIAESGMPFVLDMEGSGVAALTKARRVAVIVGIDQVVPTFEDAATLSAAWASAALGEADVPAALFLDPAGSGWEASLLLWVDNGRSQMLSGGWGDLLRCIHCGACAAVCPLTREVGDHPWGTPYAGPVALVWGAVTNPAMYGQAPQASTLCGACADVCPVGVDLPRLIAKARQHCSGPQIHTWLAKALPWHRSDARGGERANEEKRGQARGQS